MSGVQFNFSQSLETHRKNLFLFQSLLLVLIPTFFVNYLRLNAGWQKLCEGTKGLRHKVWTGTIILSPNIRYFVAILRFVAIYALYKASFRPDSDKIQLSFVQTQTKDSFLSSRLNERQLPFIQTQMKDSFLSSRLRRKTISFRPDSDERQLPFIKTQTKDNFFSSRLRRKTASFCQDSDVRQLLFVQTQTKHSFPSSRLRQKTVSFRLDFDKLQHSFVWTQTRNCSFSSKVKNIFP